jgi:integrase
MESLMLPPGFPDRRIAVKLTGKAVNAAMLPEGQQDAIFFDDELPGFGLRLRASGSRTFVYQYRLGRKTRRLTLGTASAATLAAARKSASELEAKVRLGGDPAMVKAAARQAAADTFGSLATEYLEKRKADWRPKSEGEFRHYLLTKAKPLHTVPVTAVSQRNVADLLDRIADESGTVTANRARASLSAFFRWCIEKGIDLPAGNVVGNTKKRKEVTRDRVLSRDELKAIWTACGDDSGGKIVRLLILTGQRTKEIGDLSWTEVSEDQIVLPESRTKNGRTHVVPLSEPAKVILTSTPRGVRDYLFGRWRGFTNWSRHKIDLDKRSGVKGWTFHDLRRTTATGMADLGIQPHIIEAVLNHVSGHKAGVAGIYNGSSYDREKRDALNIWGEHITALIEGRAPAVVAMKRV